MKIILLPIILTALISPAALSQPVWETNMDEAKQKAIKENKGLLIEFTGSDWCGYCIVLKKNVLTNEAFLKIAQDNYVFVELDFPKKPLSPEQTQHNQKYNELYQIEGYPTIIFADAAGTPVHSFIGNRTLEKGLAEINLALEQQKTLSNLIKKHKEERGDERYKTIGKISEIVPVKYFAHFFPDLIKELNTDGNDISGVVKKLEEHSAKKKLEKITEDIRTRKIATLKDSLKTLDDFLQKTSEIDNSTRQNAMELMARLYKNGKMIDESVKAYKEAIASNPESETAAAMRSTSTRLEADKAKILAEMKQTDHLSAFLAALPEETRNSPALFINELKDYIEKNNPVNYVRYGAKQLIFFALLADNKIDEASGTLKEIATLIGQDDQGLAESIKQIESQLDTNKEAFHKQLKEAWSSKFIEDFRLSRWLDYSLPLR